MGLPALDSIVKAVQKEVKNLDRITFVCVQHLLYTSLDIFEALIELGANPNNMFLIGKHYSTCPDVVNKAIAMGIQVQKLTPLQSLGEYEKVFNQDVDNMWTRVRKHLKKNSKQTDRLMVLDDGGRCFKAMPKDISRQYHVVGLEQTTAGLVELNSLTIHNAVYVDVAKSASKSLEVDMISAVILDKMSNKLPAPKSGSTFGIVGIGAIGSALVKRMILLGYDVLLYDAHRRTFDDTASQSIRHTMSGDDTSLSSNVRKLRQALPKSFQEMNVPKGKIQWVDSVESLIHQSDYVFGCTGKDFAQSLDIKSLITGHKHFISCSSEDKEFLSILQYIQENNPKNEWDPLGDVQWRINSDTTIHVVKGGFPCNFDHSGTSVPAKDIQLTRALILGGLIQAIVAASSYRMNGIRGSIMLDPTMQRFIVSKWATQSPFRNPKTENFEQLNWIIQHSNGQFHQLSYFSSLFDNIKSYSTAQVS